MLDFSINGTVTGSSRSNCKEKSENSTRFPAITIKDASTDIAPMRRNSKGVLGGMITKVYDGVEAMDKKMATFKQASGAGRRDAGHAGAGMAAHLSAKPLDNTSIPGFLHDECSHDSASTLSNNHQSGIVLDMTSAGKHSGQEIAFTPAPDRQPKSMQRAKVWSADVENAFRFQTAGWRDMHEYLSVYPAPSLWEDVGFVRCLQNKAGNFMYFRNRRECEDKHLPKVKTYTYD